MKTERRAWAIIFLAWLAYLVSYMGRANYGSCMLTILTETGASRASAGMASSAFALCNAFGQLVSGFIIKKLPPVRVICAALFTAAAVNLLLPSAGSFALMALLWGINGAMQSTLLAEPHRFSRKPSGSPTSPGVRFCSTPSVPWAVCSIPCSHGSLSVPETGRLYFSPFPFCFLCWERCGSW